MKKQYLRGALCLLLALILCTTVFAAGGSYVIDEAGLLTADEAAALNAQAATISEEYGVGVYIAAIEDFTDYGYSVEEASESVYLSYGLGLGEEENGILLLLSMDDRDYDLCAYGKQAHIAFTDYGKDQLADAFLDNFRNDDWFGGFRDYVVECGEYLRLAAEGDPVDVAGSSGDIYYYDENGELEYVEHTDAQHGIFWAPGWIVSAILGVLLALLIAWIVKRTTMRSVAAKAEAGNYVTGAPNFYARSDQFTHVTESRRKIERSNNSSGGGTSVNSGGFSHSSGKF